MDKPDHAIRIVFMGTPAFAVASLKALVINGYDVAGVVTVPDKPAGRGRKLRQSEVKEFALEHHLPLAQPVSLRDPAFLQTLRGWKPDLIIVVAFRMLPEEVWKIPPMGTFNLHASLLPQYRGAAPVNRAIMAGDTLTGLTTFLIDDQIDTGGILLQTPVEIGAEESAGELHDKLMEVGAQLVQKTVDLISKGEAKPQPQIIPSEGLRTAPKIHKEETFLNWNRPVLEILNTIRGLSPYPAAIMVLKHPDQGMLTAKVFKASMFTMETRHNAPTLVSDGKHYLHIHLVDGVIAITDLQLQGRKRMEIKEFLRGFPVLSGWLLAAEPGFSGDF